MNTYKYAVQLHPDGRSWEIIESATLVLLGQYYDLNNAMLEMQRLNKLTISSKTQPEL